VIPADTELTDRHDEIPAWDDMPAELKPVLVRQMEVYAGFLEYTDHRVGRLVDALQDIGILGDTLVYYVIGDNGASAEDTLHGTFNEMIKFNGAAAIEMPAFMAARLGDFGGPDSYNHYAVGWAHAMDAPLQWTKQVASHWAAPATGRSCTGRAASTPGASCATSSTTSSIWHPPCWRSRGCPRRSASTGCSRCRCTA
jgi:arylsulfatase A-like enzyme